MTPPDTNIEKQTRRHIWPLVGIALAALVGGGLTFYWIGAEVVQAPPTTSTAEESAREQDTGDESARPTDGAPTD